MEQTIFKTTTGTITLKQDVLHFRRVLEKNNFRSHSFLLFVVLIVGNLLIYMDKTLPTNADKFKLLSWTVILLIWMFPHLEYTFNWLFRFTWKNRIKLSAIQSVERMETVNELECGVRLRLKNGRVKEVLFRIEEGYAEKLLSLFEPKGIVLS